MYTAGYSIISESLAAATRNLRCSAVATSVVTALYGFRSVISGAATWLTEGFATSFKTELLADFASDVVWAGASQTNYPNAALPVGEQIKQSMVFAIPALLVPITYGLTLYFQRKLDDRAYKAQLEMYTKRAVVSTLAIPGFVAGWCFGAELAEDTLHQDLWGSIFSGVFDGLPRILLLEWLLFECLLENTLGWFQSGGAEPSLTSVGRLVCLLINLVPGGAWQGLSSYLQDGLFKKDDTDFGHCLLAGLIVAMASAYVCFIVDKIVDGYFRKPEGETLPIAERKTSPEGAFVFRDNPSNITPLLQFPINSEVITTDAY